MNENKGVEKPLTKIQVIPQWRKVFFTYSFWFYISSILLTFVEQILPFFSLLEPTMTTQTYAICVFTLNALGVLSRFIKQKNLWSYSVNKNYPVNKPDESTPNDS